MNSVTLGSVGEWDLLAVRSSFRWDLALVRSALRDRKLHQSHFANRFHELFIGNNGFWLNGL